MKSELHAYSPGVLLFKVIMSVSAWLIRCDKWRAAVSLYVFKSDQTAIISHAGANISPEISKLDTYEM